MCVCINTYLILSLLSSLVITDAIMISAISATAMLLITVTSIVLVVICIRIIKNKKHGMI